MKDGAVQQIDTPIEVFNNPANLFVAQFIGTPQMNIISECNLYQKTIDVISMYAVKKLNSTMNN